MWKEGRLGSSSTGPRADVFKEAARDKQRWDEHVRDPALKYVARSGVNWKKSTGPLVNVSRGRALNRRRQVARAVEAAVAQAQKD